MAFPATDEQFRGHGGIEVENRLVSASGAKTASLAYDPLGRLFQTSGGAAGTTRFLYDGDALVAEYDGSGTMLRRYLHGPGPDEPFIWYEGADLATRRRLQVDRQGSTISVSDHLGAILTINSYDAWGIPGAANAGRFQYTGQAWIGELGMYHYKARIYSPTLGRFLQVDPIGYKDQMNLYTYVANDPVNNADPTGTVITVADPELRRRLTTQINTLTRSTYGFDRNGNLRRESRTGGSGRGTYYDRRLMQAIGARQVVSIAQNQTATSASGIRYDVDRNCRGACTIPDTKTGGQNITVSGNSSVIITPSGYMFRESPGEIVMHELVGHAIPRIVGRDTGNAVANENKVRRENGLPLRPAERDHWE